MKDSQKSIKFVFHWENETKLSQLIIKMSHIQQSKNEIKKTKSNVII